MDYFETEEEIRFVVFDPNGRKFFFSNGSWITMEGMKKFINEFFEMTEKNEEFIKIFFSEVDINLLKRIIVITSL